MSFGGGQDNYEVFRQNIQKQRHQIADEDETRPSYSSMFAKAG